MDVGGDLRRARTARGLSLADIAQRTKISQSLLRAIEENRFDRVPGGVFTRGYLRAYAREVQLDSETVVDNYRAEFEAPVQLEPSTVEPPQVVDVDSMATPDGGRGGRSISGLVVVLMIGVTYFGFARDSTPRPTSDNLPRPTDALEASAHEAVPTPTTGSLDGKRSATLKLVIQTKADCWVAGSVDGQAAIARLMRAGDRDQFDVRDQAILRVGDPAAFSFTLDGIPGRVLGTAGTAVNLSFNRQNYTSVLSERPL